MNTGTPRALFVYGTLRPGGRYWSSISDYVVHYDPALLTGYEIWHLDDGYPAIVPGHGGVFGDLLYIRQGREKSLFAVTDGIEEYAANDPASLYLRIETTVARLQRPNGPPIPAETYVFNPAHRPYLQKHGKLLKHSEWTAADAEEPE